MAPWAPSAVRSIAPRALLLLVLVSSACGPTATSTSGPTPSAAAASSPSATLTVIPTAAPAPSPRATRRPFLWALVANGSSSFVAVTGAEAGTVCSIKAFLKSGSEISGSGLKPHTVTDVSQGVSWSDQGGPLFSLPSPAPSPGEDAYWLITCVKDALDPPSGTTTSAFQTP